MSDNLVGLFLFLAAILGIFFVAALVEVVMLWLFPSHYPNVLREDAHRESDEK